MREGSREGSLDSHTEQEEISHLLCLYRLN